MVVANLCHIIATLSIIRRRQCRNHKGAKSIAAHGFGQVLVKNCIFYNTFLKVKDRKFLASSARSSPFKKPFLGSVFYDLHLIKHIFHLVKKFHVV